MQTHAAGALRAVAAAHRAQTCLRLAKRATRALHLEHVTTSTSSLNGTNRIFGCYNVRGMSSAATPASPPTAATAATKTPAGGETPKTPTSNASSAPSGQHQVGTPTTSIESTSISEAVSQDTKNTELKAAQERAHQEAIDKRNEVEKIRRAAKDIADTPITHVTRETIVSNAKVGKAADTTGAGSGSSAVAGASASTPAEKEAGIESNSAQPANPTGKDTQRDNTTAETGGRPSPPVKEPPTKDDPSKTATPASTNTKPASKMQAQDATNNPSGNIGTSKDAEPRPEKKSNESMKTEVPTRVKTAGDNNETSKASTITQKKTPEVPTPTRVVNANESSGVEPCQNKEVAKNSDLKDDDKRQFKSAITLPPLSDGALTGGAKDIVVQETSTGAAGEGTEPKESTAKSTSVSNAKNTTSKKSATDETGKQSASTERSSESKKQTSTSKKESSTATTSTTTQTTDKKKLDTSNSNNSKVEEIDMPPKTVASLTALAALAATEALKKVGGLPTSTAGVKQQETPAKNNSTSTTSDAAPITDSTTSSKKQNSSTAKPTGAKSATRNSKEPLKTNGLTTTATTTTVGEEQDGSEKSDTVEKVAESKASDKNDSKKVSSYTTASSVQAKTQPVNEAGTTPSSTTTTTSGSETGTPKRNALQKSIIEEIKKDTLKKEDLGPAGIDFGPLLSNMQDRGLTLEQAQALLKMIDEAIRESMENVSKVMATKQAQLEEYRKAERDFKLLRSEIEQLEKTDSTSLREELKNVAELVDRISQSESEEIGRVHSGTRLDMNLEKARAKDELEELRSLVRRAEQRIDDDTDQIVTRMAEIKEGTRTSLYNIIGTILVFFAVFKVWQAYFF